MARQNFDEADDGRVHTGSFVQPKQHRCYADGCPMPGTIFTSGTDKPGVCAWHYGVSGHDVPRVTAVLKDWDVAAYEVREARRALTDPDIAAKPAVLAERFATAWERLKPLAPGWEEQLQPGTIKHRNAEGDRVTDTGLRESYGDWAKRLEAFIGARVVEVLGVRQKRAAA